MVRLVAFRLPPTSHSRQGKVWPSSRAGARVKNFQIYRGPPMTGAIRGLTYSIDLDRCDMMGLDALIKIMRYLGTAAHLADHSD